MMKKLRSKRGETLLEVLVSVVIIALSAALLATMISAATRIGIDADEAIDELYVQLSTAEGTSGSAGSVTITYGTGKTVNVTYNRTDADSLTAYVKRVGP